MTPTVCDPKDPVNCQVQMHWTVKVGEKWQVVIPKEVRDQLNIKPGDTLFVSTKHQKAITMIKQEDLATFIAYLQEELVSLQKKF